MHYDAIQKVVKADKPTGTKAPIAKTKKASSSSKEVSRSYSALSVIAIKHIQSQNKKPVGKTVSAKATSKTVPKNAKKTAVKKSAPVKAQPKSPQNEFGGYKVVKKKNKRSYIMYV